MFSFPKSGKERDEILSSASKMIFAYLKNQKTSENFSGNVLDYLYDQFMVYADQETEPIIDRKLSNNIIVEILREAWSEKRSANDGIVKFRQK